MHVKYVSLEKNANEINLMGNPKVITHDIFELDSYPHR